MIFIGPENNRFSASSSGEIAINFLEEGWMLATMVDKKFFGILDYLNGHIWTSISLGIDPRPLANHNQAVFSVSPGTEKLNNSSQADYKPR